MTDQWKDYQMYYTANNGIPVEHTYKGTIPGLADYITFLEERGCHCITIEQDGELIYENGNFITRPGHVPKGGQDG